jgi:hypothetical protein
MKNLLALFLLVFLTGCVSYYQPESALENGVYYAEDDPSYVYNPDDYSGVIYYPWSSLDYFYFGYLPYSGYGFAYDYPYAFGYLSWGYPYSYYGYYSPWYFSYYHDSYWRPYQRSCHYHGRCRDNDDRDAKDDHYAGDGHENHGRTVGGGEENAFYSHNGKDKMGRGGYPPMKRYVSKTPNGRPGSEGMAVRNSKPTKLAKSRVEPVYTRPPSPITVNPAAAGTPPRPPTAPAINTFSGQNRQSPSFNTPAHPPSSNYGKSSPHKDRD